MAHHIGALDQGTTSTRFMVFDSAGQVVSVAQREHSQIYPQPGWVEHDPEEIWRAARDVMQETTAARGLTAPDFAAIAIASRPQLVNLETLAWDKEQLDAFGIPEAMLPKICSSSEVYGEVKEGPLCGVPIAGILGDQQAALVGQACFRPGEAKNTY